jgi:hypothetical protein
MLIAIFLVTRNHFKHKKLLKMRNSLLSSTLRQLSRRTSFGIRNANSSSRLSHQRLQLIEWQATKSRCLPGIGITLLDFPKMMTSRAEENISRNFPIGCEDEDGT